MFPETSVPITAPERAPSGGNLEADRRGYDVGVHTSPEVATMLETNVNQVMFATQIGDPDIHGHIVTVHPNDPKAVILSSKPGAPTTAQLIGKSPGYRSKHGSSPFELVLDEKAQQRFGAIVEELTALFIEHVRANPSEKRSRVSLAGLENKFGTSPFSSEGVGSYGQGLFDHRRGEYLERLRKDVEQESDERGVPLRCNFDSLDNSAEVVVPLEENPPRGFFGKFLGRFRRD